MVPLVTAKKACSDVSASRYNLAVVRPAAPFLEQAVHLKLAGHSVWPKL